MAKRLSLIYTGQDPQIWPSLQMHLGPLDMAFTILVIGLLTAGHLLLKVVLPNGRSSIPFFFLFKNIFHCLPQKHLGTSIPLLSPASCGVIRGWERKSSFTAGTRQSLISGLLALPETPTSCTLSTPYFSVVLLTISQSSSLILLAPITQLLTLYPVCRWCCFINSPRQQS